MLDILDRRIYGASLTRWLIALATLFAVYLVLSLGRRWLKNRVGRWAARTETEWDDLIVDLIGRTKHFFLITIAVLIASRIVPSVRGMSAVLKSVLVVVALLQFGIWANAIIAFAVERYTRTKTSGDVASRATVATVGYAARAALWALIGLTGLSWFDVDIRAALGALGIGGIAVALAAQNVLGDLFAAVAIVLDKPFVVGDAIAFDAYEGEIEEIGLKTTRIRSVNGEQVIVANSELLKTRIRNYGRMRQRRSAFYLDLSPDTPPDRIAKVPDAIKAIIEKQPNTRFDRCHFLTFSDTAPRLDVVYYVTQRDYRLYADTQQAINLEILRHFNSDGIKLAPMRAIVAQR